MQEIQLSSKILEKLDSNFYSKVDVTPLSNPKIVNINTPLALNLGFDKITFEAK